MPLSPGTHLGPYEIRALIGKGGMGEVYRAHDPRLGRDVAIKVSAERFSERFEREARLIASLNHPNICTLYDVGPDYLVMEYIEGESPKGPMPLEGALKIARQIADALEAAHEKPIPITHRDLKPANIKIKPDGLVKVLDFGLAKAHKPPPEDGATATMGLTEAGTILGTPAYMSPEQAVGKKVDKRSDIWAFGVVLYEMLSGERPFKGAEIGDILESVVKEQPDFSKTPPAVHRLLRKCLEKDPRQRLRDIGDVWELMEDAPEVEAAEAAPLRSRFGSAAWVAWAVAVVFALAFGSIAFVHFRETPPAERVLRYTVAAPENSIVHSFAVSPDGRTVAIAAAVNGKRQLWLRALDALQAQPMAFTEDAAYPFWSPDGRYIGFFAQGNLKKIAASGGPSESLCDAADGSGGSWNRDGAIVFSPDGAGGAAIQRVLAAGGVPSDVTKTKGLYRFPVFLPNGRHFLYLLSIAGPEKNGVYFSSLDGSENRRVLAVNSSVVFAPPVSGSRGQLLFVRDNTLMAQPFDAGSGQLSGDAFPVGEGVSFTAVINFAPVTVSGNGVLLYSSGGIGSNQMVWFDRAGKLLGPVGASGPVLMPSISPDEKTIAFSRRTGGAFDIWLRDLARGTDMRFTSDASVNFDPFWSPKGDRIAFFSTRGGHGGDLYQRAASVSGQDELLLSTPNPKTVNQWSRDGKFIVYTELDPKTKWDLWVLPAGERKPVLFLKTEFNEFQGQISPDGRWMAYTSDESGQSEVYVRPFPASDGVWRISTAGGEQPRWRGDGKEIFFWGTDGKMTAVAVKASAGAKPSFEAGAPVPLFEAHIADIVGVPVFQYDVTADGRRFLVDTGTPASTQPLTVVVNWQAGLKR